MTAGSKRRPRKGAAATMVPPGSGCRSWPCCSKRGPPVASRAAPAPPTPEAIIDDTDRQAPDHPGAAALAGRFQGVVFDLDGVVYLGDEVVPAAPRSAEHTSELQSRGQLVCRLLLEKK